MVKRKKTNPTICIVESLKFLEENAYREGEIISKTLCLSEKEAHYSYIRTKDELVAFAKEFGQSKHRYLHISCHGSKKSFWTTTGRIAAAELASILAPHVSKRRVFLSACLAAESEFAGTLLSSSDCYSVLAPMGNICFDDAAIFWTSFYHLMFKYDPDSMTRSRIRQTVRTCGTLVEERFRFFYRTGNKVKFETMGG